MIKIALDYDNTYTLDPAAWNDILNSFYLWNFDVRVVTLRSSFDDPVPDAPVYTYWTLDENGDDCTITKEVPIIYCYGRPKKGVCEEMGWVPDVWIDDRPESIYGGSSLTPDMLQAWRNNGRK